MAEPLAAPSEAPAPSPRTRYAALLERALFAAEPLDVETALAEAADLGRELVRRETPPEELSEMHHDALVRLARAHPELRLEAVAERLTAPLMEAYMAYSLAFREQLERRTEHQLNLRLEQSRRLEAIGTLAAGIAHDFNNILGAIVGRAELLGDEIAPASPAERHVRIILQASFRARDLIARMLTFAREMGDEPAPMDALPAILDSIELLRATLPAGVELHFQTSLDAAWMLAEPSQIQQILMNLCVNAADAMPDGRGHIRIELSPSARRTPEGESELWCLRVSDSGEGMTPELQERVFDPFFTTKAPGKGSGLGLSVIHGLVSKLGGIIELKSTPGAGSQFSIYLPRIEAPTAEEDPHGPHSDRG